MSINNESINVEEKQVSSIGFHIKTNHSVNISMGEGLSKNSEEPRASDASNYSPQNFIEGLKEPQESRKRKTGEERSVLFDVSDNRSIDDSVQSHSGAESRTKVAKYDNTTISKVVVQHEDPVSRQNPSEEIVKTTTVSTPSITSTASQNEEKKNSDDATPNYASKVKAVQVSKDRRSPVSDHTTDITKENQFIQMPECDAYFRSLVNLDPIPDAPPIKRLSPRELAQLELSLQIGEKFSDYSNDTTWREDWNGNLQLIDKDIIMNLDELATNPTAKKKTIPFCDWVAKLARHGDDFTGVKLLFSFVYHMEGTPLMAKRILAYYVHRPVSSISERLQCVMEACRRISYDPIVLTHDGWTTVKADVPDGFTGGSFLIGRRLIWEKYEAVVIAFVKDEDIGDLWKCLWIEDFDTFDLEADELLEGMKKWEKIVAKRKTVAVTSKQNRPSNRFEANRNFTVNGIEHGIVLAKSYRSKAGHPWPARIMHVTEVKALGSQIISRRSSSKNEIHVVFLAPFWNGDRNGTGSNPAPATSKYATGPLFEVETIDVSSETILEYPHSVEDGKISITNLQSEFRFLGLPKAAFPRFLDSHRIAMALKTYAKTEIKKFFQSAIDVDATAALTDTHPMSIKTFTFPEALLHLPFEYILSKYPDPAKQKLKSFMEDDTEVTEPIMQLHTILKTITPPNCWGESFVSSSSHPETPVKKVQPLSLPDSKGLTPTMSPTLDVSLRVSSESEKRNLWGIESFASAYLLRHIQPLSNGNVTPLHFLQEGLRKLVKNLNKVVIESEEALVQDLESRKERLASILVQCLSVKGQCEEMLFSTAIPDHLDRLTILKEWRKACERVFKRSIIRLGHVDSGNGVTAVLTDSRCNEHITASGSFERAVRIPAAVKGAKSAGVGSRPSLPLITKIENEYLTLAEEKILPMAHKVSYLKRIKTKVSSLAQDAKGVPLTDGSDGEGGEDTMGSRGSYTAAVTAVATALKAVDMIVGGKCVNAFCAVRPPGHHAGRELHPMNAISNGFCLLNNAAAAALYAASPRSQGGLGLKRVCIIDFDVHHGNGTQDILCSTYDPRFLYVSTHAGGSHINGYEDDAIDDGLRRSPYTNHNEGIYPGRCGDVSPHPGVLNIPLGKKVTPSSLGTSLICQVTPAVEKFDPELIIISAGFDAHVNDPLGMGGLSAEDFGTVTKVICQMALKSCSGRILSILEGGYGIPCCKPLDKDLFLPKNSSDGPQLKWLKLGSDLPDNMEDNMDYLLAKKLDKCHQEGFLECVKEHVRNLAANNNLDSP
eukprot:CAMPEP_0176480238 /NCGR_PEP_ID=MMETSP0200_2-20121128/2171_1 /TAXON_ID=947934 /ORGANISM="Chaetoceros sp., Strain GSL56" /LENGTH=1283 /DNA_ID=CAMNT_0017876345 /DNA_START=485 /DNA_END=4336 /DNA_ORIENTATION=+